MTKDKALEELFLAQTPHFTDSDRFMASLTKRLDAVEYLKQYQERTIRRYKMMMVAAFVVASSAVASLSPLSYLRPFKCPSSASKYRRVSFCGCPRTPALLPLPVSRC